MIENHIKAHLDALNLGAPVYMGPVRAADPPAMPHRAMFVLETGGPAPSPFMDTQVGTWRYMRAQVRVRSEAKAYTVGRDLAQSVWSALQETTVTGGYVRVTIEQSAPFYLGCDALQNHEWSINALLEKRA